MSKLTAWPIRSVEVSEAMLDGVLDSFVKWNMTLSVVGVLEVNLKGPFKIKLYYHSKTGRLRENIISLCSLFILFWLLQITGLFQD